MQKTFPAVQEQLVGISEYLEPGEQLQAITKYLLSDFIVNQIDPTGQVVQLKNKPIPQTQTVKEKESYDYSKELKQECEAVLGKQCSDEIQKLYQKLDTGQKVTEWQYMLKDVPHDRQIRIKIHSFVREKLINIQSTTLEDKGLRVRFNKRLRKMNPASRHKWTYFKLFKSNIDTNGALFKLSKITGISQKVFSTAGLKDKRGITTQMVAVFNSDIGSLRKFYLQASRNKEMWIDQFEENKQKNIGVGDLFGNQFCLILRLLNPKDQDLIQRRVMTLRQIGMINYFGMQRFGSFKTKTHTLGIMVLKKQWKELIQQLVLGDCGHFQTNRFKKQIYESKQFGRAEKGLSNKNKIQKLVFRALSRHGLNYSNVFESLPRSIKTLYIHSTQSYIWNKVVSRRLRQHGLKLVENDLVGRIRQHIKQQKVVQIQNQQKLEDELNDLAQQQALEQDIEFETSLINSQNINGFTINDLVAPLYGPSAAVPKQSILYPYIEDQLNTLGLKHEDFLQNSKLLCFQGQYRKMIIKPTKVEHSIVKHKSQKVELQTAFFYLGQVVIPPSGGMRSVRLLLQLPKSSYATMAIRQILHLPSQYNVQMELNRMYDALDPNVVEEQRQEQ